MAQSKRLHVIFQGSVQGVNFRWYTEQAARGIGLTGIVKNLADGTVEMVAEGERTAINELMCYLCSERGPGEVSHAQETWSEATGEFSDFNITY